MRYGVAAIAALLALPGCGTVDGAQRASSPPPGAVVTMLSRSGVTATGQPVGPPSAPVEIVFSRAVLPAGGVLPVHQHPWPRYVYVESGRIRVRYEAVGIEREFGPGETLIESVDQWHEAVAVGAAPVRLLVIDQVPPGQTNVVRR